MRSCFRALSILSAAAAVIELVFWVVDQVEKLPFHGKWLLVSSIIWSVVFYFLSRWRTANK